MADQAALDQYRAQIRQDTHDVVCDVLRAPEFELHRSYIALDVQNVVADVLRAQEFRVQTLYQNDENIGAVIASLTAKVDALIAKLS